MVANFKIGVGSSLKPEGQEPPLRCRPGTYLQEEAPDRVCGYFVKFLRTT